ncbi:MAG: hypothetical protein AABY15_08925 [Nanoarchaeota archaeon]
MKSEIKNVHNESITLFVKIDGVEQRVSIPAGESMVIDAYDTKTIRAFRQRGFVTMQEHRAPIVDPKTGNINLKYNPEFVAEDYYTVSKKESSETTIEPATDSNNDEPMDHFHTTEDHKLEPITDIEYLQKKLINALTPSPTSFEIIEEQVEQYVEDGYIKGEWSDEDIEFLKKNYPTKGRKYCSTHLNRNESSVQKKINALDLKKKKKKK